MGNRCKLAPPAGEAGRLQRAPGAAKGEDRLIYPLHQPDLRGAGAAKSQGCSGRVSQLASSYSSLIRHSFATRTGESATAPPSGSFSPPTPLLHPPWAGTPGSSAVRIFLPLRSSQTLLRGQSQGQRPLSLVPFSVILALPPFASLLERP